MLLKEKPVSSLLKDNILHVVGEGMLFNHLPLHEECHTTFILSCKTVKLSIWNAD